MGNEQPGPDPDESRGTGIWRNLNGRTQIVVAVIGVVGTIAAAVLAAVLAGGGGDDPRGFDPAGDQTYYLGGSYPFAPIAPSDGGWHVVDQGLGSPGDANSPHIIYLVDASPLCGRTLHAAKPDKDGNVIYKTLPPGCSVADSVDVTVAAYPSEPAGN